MSIYTHMYTLNYINLFFGLPVLYPFYPPYRQTPAMPTSKPSGQGFREARWGEQGAVAVAQAVAFQFVLDGGWGPWGECSHFSETLKKTPSISEEYSENWVKVVDLWRFYPQKLEWVGFKLPKSLNSCLVAAVGMAMKFYPKHMKNEKCTKIPRAISMGNMMINHDRPIDFGLGIPFSAMSYWHHVVQQCIILSSMVLQQPRKR